jgi:hypothetical protein
MSHTIHESRFEILAHDSLHAWSLVHNNAGDHLAPQSSDGRRGADVQVVVI